ncbi:hypothetical protein ZWY2020_015654 [Hordeum vulgare]|nr:hypothetical protein ZWY2020_015654 [Hordeum vulgare]
MSASSPAIHAAALVGVGWLLSVPREDTLVPGGRHHIPVLVMWSLKMRWREGFADGAGGAAGAVVKERGANCDPEEAEDEETPKMGLTIEIDGFKLIVGDLHEAHQGDLHKSKVSFDLHSNSPRFGGHFWVLADQESDDEVEEINYEEFKSSTAVADAVRLEPGTIRQRVRAEARGPRKDMAKQKVRPWIGPLPTEKLAPITLSDFFPAAGWCVVKGKKKNKMVSPTITESAPATEPRFTQAEMRFQRESFLNSALMAAGFMLDSNNVNTNGYMAQEESPVVDESKSDSSNPGYKAQAIAMSTAVYPVRSAGLGGLDHEGSLPCMGSPGPRVPRRQQHGFPLLGPGRAARVPPPPSAVRNMAGRGASKQPPAAQPRPIGQGDRSSTAKQPAAAQMARLPPGAAQEDNPGQPVRWGSVGIRGRSSEVAGAMTAATRMGMVNTAGHHLMVAGVGMQL